MNPDEFSAALMAELNRRVQRDGFRLVALVDIGNDRVLRERLAEACVGIKHPVVAVFETTTTKIPI